MKKASKIVEEEKRCAPGDYMSAVDQIQWSYKSNIRQIDSC